MGRWWPLPVMLAVLTAALGGTAQAAVPPSPCAADAVSLAAVECAGIVPVPSLDPAATDAAWQSLALAAQAAPAPAAAPACRPLRAVFYAATDWNRLATTLA